MEKDAEVTMLTKETANRKRESFLSALQSAGSHSSIDYDAKFKDTIVQIRNLQKIVWFLGLYAKSHQQSSALKIASGPELPKHRDTCLSHLLKGKLVHERHGNSKEEPAPAQTESPSTMSLGPQCWLPPDCWSILEQTISQDSSEGIWSNILSRPEDCCESYEVPEATTHSDCTTQTFGFRTCTPMSSGKHRWCIAPVKQ